MEMRSPIFKLTKRGLEEGLKESSEALFDPVGSWSIQRDGALLLKITQNY